MPTSEVPTNVNDSEPGKLQGSEPVQLGGPTPEPAESDEARGPRLRGSRWVDYDTHELLEMISELEDERRFARLREGIWLAVLLHILLISAITWIPKYVFKAPTVIDPFDAIQKRKDLTYLDALPDAIRELHPPKVVIKPVPPKRTTVDKQTLEALNRPVPRPAAPAAPTTPAPQPAAQPTPQPPAPSPSPSPAPTLPSPVAEAPRPSAVPARPSFAMNSDNPADQMREAMRNASRNPGAGSTGTGGIGSALHPGAGGSVEILSPTDGVDFRAWLERWRHETINTWEPLIPAEVDPPLSKSGMVVIRFRVLPNGRLVEPNGVILEGRSGDTALDRAAWGALTGSNYPPLPRDFHEPYLELRAYFLYNMQPPK